MPPLSNIRKRELIRSRQRVTICKGKDPGLERSGEQCAQATFAYPAKNRRSLRFDRGDKTAGHRGGRGPSTPFGCRLTSLRMTNLLATHYAQDDKPLGDSLRPG